MAIKSWTIILLLTSVSVLNAQDSLIKKSVFFGGGSYYIDDIQIQEINDFIQKVEKLENYEIVIFSHTDNIGGKEYNDWLSKMRSTAVMRELLLVGIPKEMMKVKDIGQDNPLYTNNSYGGRGMNRRVDIILSPLVF